MCPISVLSKFRNQEHGKNCDTYVDLNSHKKNNVIHGICRYCREGYVLVYRAAEAKEGWKCVKEKEGKDEGCFLKFEKFRN